MFFTELGRFVAGAAFIAIVAMSGIGSVSGGDKVQAFSTAADVLSDCESTSASLNSKCESYLTGIVDTYSSLLSLGLIPQRAFCFPDMTSDIMLRKAFEKYANDNPQDLHLIGATMALVAFGTAFPCE